MQTEKVKIESFNVKNICYKINNNKEKFNSNIKNYRYGYKWKADRKCEPK